MHNYIDNPHFWVFENQQRTVHYQWNCDISASRGRTMTFLGTKSIRRPRHIWWAGNTRVQNGFRPSYPYFQVLRQKKHGDGGFAFRDCPFDFSKDYNFSISWLSRGKFAALRQKSVISCLFWSIPTKTGKFEQFLRTIFLALTKKSTHYLKYARLTKP